MSVGSSIWAHNHCFHYIHSFLITPHIDWVGMFLGECSRHISKLLGKSDQLWLGCSVIRLNQIHVIRVILSWGWFFQINIVKSEVRHENLIFLSDGELQNGVEFLFLIFTWIFTLEMFLADLINKSCNLDDLLSKSLGLLILLCFINFLLSTFSLCGLCNSKRGLRFFPLIWLFTDDKENLCYTLQFHEKILDTLDLIWIEIFWDWQKCWHQTLMLITISK